MPNSQFSSLDQYEQYLFARIEALAPERRTAFSAAMAERWLHVYIAFSESEEWGDPSFLRHSLDVVWSHLKGKTLSHQDVARYLGQIEDITPHMDYTDDFSALAACIMVAEAVECCGSDNNASPAIQAVMSGFEAVVPNWEMELESQPRLWQQVLVQREMKTQVKLIDEIESISQFDEATVQLLCARMQSEEYLGKVMPTSDPVPGRATITNQDAFERFHAVIEVDLRDDERNRWEEEYAPGTYMWAIYLFSSWSGRYSRREQILYGEYGQLADQVAVQALMVKNQALDKAAAGTPNWGKELPELMSMTIQNNPGRQDFSAYDQPHKCGPSLRRLWLEGEQIGLDPTQHILNWVRLRPQAWEIDTQRKKKGQAHTTPELGDLLSRELVWEDSGYPQQPWTTAVGGEDWQVRLNDFPDDFMYSLLINGKDCGSFHDWPETWQRR